MILLKKLRPILCNECESLAEFGVYEDGFKVLNLCSNHAEEFKKKTKEVE